MFGFDDVYCVLKCCHGLPSSHLWSESTLGYEKRVLDEFLEPVVDDAGDGFQEVV